MDSTVEWSLLLDYYGELLTPRQRELCDMSFNQDLSLSEIAENTGVSRQAVHDSLRRAEAALLDFEQKTGCIARARELEPAVRSIRSAAELLAQHTDPAVRAAAALIRSTLDGLERDEQAR